MFIRKGSIYIIKNKCNSKVYIGQTIQDVAERSRQHLKPSVIKQSGTYKIYNAIKKYGKENFYYEILEGNIDSNLLNDREMYYIQLFDSYENGYNSTRGGDSKVISSIEDINTLITMLDNGCTNQEMADYFDVSKATIRRTLKAIGRGRKNEPKISKEELIKYQDLYNYEIAEIFNVDTRTVSRSFQRYGIPRGRGCNAYKVKQNQKKCND